ncbi:hypothetical protein DMJ13_16540 [halophilic archaeon]|nr:hypothetical protein DMJ13_16540 [halophilic archaeon]
MHDDPPSANEDVARLRLELRRTDLSTLVDRGILTWDQEANIVRKGPQFDAVTPLSDLPANHGGRLPDDYL